MAYPYGQDGDAPPTNGNELASFRLENVQGCTVVVACGEVDLHTAPGLREALLAARESSGTVIIDLTRVTFMDSSGLGVMVGALDRAKQEKGSVLLVGPTPMVRKVLGITRLDEIFPVYATLEAAVAQQKTTA